MKPASRFRSFVSPGYTCVLALVMFPMSIGRSDAAQALGPGQETITIPRGTRVLLCLSGTLSGKKNRLQPPLVLTKSVAVDGLTVIPAGRAVQYRVVVKPPGRFAMPGSVTIEVVGVYAISGEMVPLTAERLSADGEPPCAMEGCLALPLLFWYRGDPGEIKEGALLKAAVSEDVVLHRAAIPRPAGPGDPPELVRIHVYQVPAPQLDAETENGFGQSSSRLTDYFLDGKRVGRIGDFRYACFVSRPGPHTLRFDRNVISLDAEVGEERYFRVTSTLPALGSSEVEETAGYDFDGGFLIPAILGGSGAPCFAELK